MVLGCALGCEDGCDDGCELGFEDGCDDGTMVGCDDGSEVGCEEGTPVGTEKQGSSPDVTTVPGRDVYPTAHLLQFSTEEAPEFSVPAVLVVMYRPLGQGVQQSSLVQEYVTSAV